MSFETRRGLGVHSRRAHTDEFHRAIAEADQERRKNRWSTSEIETLARLEVDLVASGSRKDRINLAILQTCAFEGRTQESIKGVRQTVKYKDLITQLTAERSAVHSPVDPSRSQGGHDSSVSADDWCRPIVQLLRSLHSSSRQLVNMMYSMYVCSSLHEKPPCGTT